MPIPHKTLLGSPLTEVRQDAPAIATATATLVPNETATADPLTVIDTVSGMSNLA
jgi:hypothetical protein